MLSGPSRYEIKIQNGYKKKGINRNIKGVWEEKEAGGCWAAHPGMRSKYKMEIRKKKRGSGFV